MCESTFCLLDDLGDGICDPECDDPNCGFDMGDCGYCSSGCSKELLENDVCDKVCDTIYCRFDNFDCAECSPGCFYSMIRNGVCDPACDNMFCDYDQGSCGRCSEVCELSMIGDGFCDLACTTAKCSFDAEDCNDHFIGECFDTLIGNGYCDDACNIEETHWDEGDCDCAPGCTHDLQFNDICDVECMATECRYDNLNCVSSSQGTCASGCFDEMLGDGICQKECFTYECDLDSGDCVCSEGCGPEERGKCKAECMVAACNYDSFGEKDGCQDELLLTLAYTYQSLKHNVNLVYDAYECFKICNRTEFRLAYKTHECLSPACMTEMCMYGLGGCDVSNRTGELNCKVSDWLGNCVECFPGGFLIAQACFYALPRKFAPFSPKPEFAIPLADVSNSTSPDVLYVAEPEKNSNEGNGSFLFPYENLVVALAAVWQRYSIINLLGEKMSTYCDLRKITPDLMAVSNPANPLAEKNFTLLTIQSLPCDSTNHPNCSEKVTTIDVSSLLLFNFTGNILIQNVYFTSSGAFKKSAPYTYCPFIQTNDEGELVDDKGNPVTAEQKRGNLVCKKFHLYSFFTVYSSSTLTMVVRSMQNVKIINFRNEMASFIDIIGGRVKLEKVQFVNVTARGISKYHAVITQNVSCGFAFCGSLQFTQGIVEFVSNGFEYSDLATLSGFLSAHSISSVSIANVNFSYSLSINPSTVDLVNGYSLLFLEDFIQLTVTNCTFYSNIATGGILTIRSAVELPKISEKGVAVAYTLQHITLTGLNFTNNFAGQSLISITFSRDLLNVEITKCVFDGNAVGLQALISIVNSQELTSLLVSGGKKGVVGSQSETVQMLWFPQRNITIRSVKFFNVSSYKELVLIGKCANLRLIDILVENSGNTVRDRIKQLFQLMVANVESGVKRLPSSTQSTNCSASFVFQEVTNVLMQDVHILNCACDSGGVGLALDHASGEISASNWDVRKSSGHGQSGLVMHFVGEHASKLTNITVEHCQMDDSGMIYIQDYAIVAISASYFHNNTGERGTCLRGDGGLYLVLWDSIFKRNSSPLNVGGVLAFTLSGSNQLKAEISDCVFEYNSASEGGVLAFGGFKVLPLELVLDRNLFRYNLASERAAVLTIQSTVSLSERSKIENCVFESCSSPFGAISAMHFSGTLLLNSSVFLNNSGEICSSLHIESQPSAQNMLLDVTFLKNKNGPAILKSSQRTFSRIQTKHCSYQDNEMGAISLEGGEWTDEGSTYSRIRSKVLSLSLGAKAQISKASFTNSTNEGDGGAVYLSSKSYFSCYQCLFRNNTALAGAAVYSEQDSTVNLNQSMVEGNVATGTGSAIVLTTSLNSDSIIYNCTLRHNKAKGSSLILSQNAALTLDTVLIYENSAGEYPGISFILSEGTLINCNFENQQSTTTPFIYASTSSIVSIINSNFVNGTGQISGAISIVSSEVSIILSSFSYISGVQSGAISSTSGSKISLREVFMQSVFSSSPGSLIFAIDSFLFIVNSVFSEYKHEGIMGIQLATMKVEASRFAYGVGSLGAALSCMQCNNITISASSFEFQQALYGGAIYLETTEGASESGDLTLSSTDFSSCKAHIGGALYIRNTKMKMDKCTFLKNTAVDSESGEGGALMLECIIAEYCRFTISKSVFQGNSASLKGGAVSWTLSKPIITDGKMVQNRAKYGPNIASFPIKLILQEVNVASSRLFKVLNSTEIWEMPPGQSAGLSFKVALVDHYAHIANIDNSSLAEIVSANLSVLVVGKTKVTAVNGVFLFDDIQVFATPGTATMINIHTSVIPDSQAGDPDAHLSTLPLTFHLRDCLPGEYRTYQSCTVCEPGTYGFDPSQPCEKCPANARCLGNYTIYPNDGYWRSGVYSARIWRCPNPDACKGGEFNNTYNLTGECATGYTGNMCQSCDHGYSRTTKNKCGKCPDREDNIIRITFIAIGAFILNIILILSTLKSSLKPKSLHSIYLKILINYLQLVLLVTDFKLEWPSPVLEIFDTQEKSGEVAEQAYSIDCILEDNSYFRTETLFAKVIVMSILPLLIFGLAIILWGVAAIYKKKPVYLSRELAATCIISFFMIHPNLMILLLSMFSCTEINSGEYWLTRDLEIRCWESDHLFYSLVLAVPATIVWVIAWPMLCLVFLIKNRRRQDEVGVKMQFGFLISGYHRRHYYWEFVIMYRKLAIICCSVFLTSSVSIQALTVQLVILAFLFLQFNVLPYTEVVLNSLELKAIIVANLTIYCGLYYLTDDLSYTSSWFFFYLILLSNLIFLAYWLICFLDFAKYNLLMKVPFLARIFVPELLSTDPYIEDFIENLALRSEGNSSSIRELSMKDIYLQLLTHSVLNVWDYSPAKDLASPAFTIADQLSD